MNYYLQGSKKLYLIKLNFDIPVYQRFKLPYTNEANVIEKTQGTSSRALRHIQQLRASPITIPVDTLDDYAL